MGSSADHLINNETNGIIPRVIKSIFDIIKIKETSDPNSSYKIQVQFLEIYGEEIKDLLDQTKTSKVSIRETVDGDVYIAGAKEEVVASAEQMFKTLEDGTKYRTTASTKMNATSSRSHAIFTVIIQHTIHAGTVVEGNKLVENEDINIEDKENDVLSSTHSKAEIRSCKFHFVDLAGSERAKRTGAQGHQLKEGIDINKGLLSLGNVISALGDESKRGKVHVPYRDSKLTRLLQDSLGGNSKTLMICCVSPSGSNYNESVNALRYANRARNIQNKPVVNRDPTFMIIDELKQVCKIMATDLLSIRKDYIYPEPSSVDQRLTNAQLSSLSDYKSQNNMISGNSLESITKGNSNNIPNNCNSYNNNSTVVYKEKNTRSSYQPTSTKSSLESKQELLKLKQRNTESDFEVHRLTELLKLSRSRESDLTENITYLQSERDFYKMKFENNEEIEDINENISEKNQFIKFSSQYIEEISSLKRKISTLEQNSLSPASSSSTNIFNGGENLLENEFSSNVASLIEQTKEHLKQETKKLTSVNFEEINSSSLNDIPSDDEDDLNPLKQDQNAIEEELEFQRRQSLLANEVTEIGQSIHLKEKLVEQLQRSQHQYSAMKCFYEQKLSALNEEMENKHSEREKLLSELENLSQSKNEAAPVRLDRVKKLNEDLKRRDEELRLLKRRQVELTNLSQVQSRQTNQLSKLVNEIETMKRQRVDLTKSLTVEKKKHLSQLNEKAKEIGKLKKELTKNNGAMKRLGFDKERAETRAKEALKESVALRKRANNLIRNGGPEAELASARAARRAMAVVSKATSTKFLSEEEVRTKKWLNLRIANISEREEAAEALKKQCELQLSLLNKRELLQNERKTFEEHSIRDYIADNVNLNKENYSKKLNHEEEEALQEIERRIESVDNQLKEKTQSIESMHIEFNSSLEDGDKTIEALKKNSANSLPAAQDLVKLLFDMLVADKKKFKLTKVAFEENNEINSKLQLELEKSNMKLSKSQREHDRELTKYMSEYEKKLEGLFSNSSLGQIVISEGTNNNQDTGHENIIESYKALLAISTEKCESLNFQINSGNKINENLDNLVNELDSTKLKLERDIQIKDNHIKFLEDERNLFRDMAEDLRNGCLQLDNTKGANILKQVKERARLKSDVYNCNSGLSSESDDDSDSESILGEFNMLAEEITRTGVVVSSTNGAKNNIYDRLTNPSNFTGAMKNVFENDLTKKRQKVLQIKKKEIVKKKDHPKDKFDPSLRLRIKDEEDGDENLAPLDDIIILSNRSRGDSFENLRGISPSNTLSSRESVSPEAIIEDIDSNEIKNKVFTRLSKPHKRFNSSDDGKLINSFLIRKDSKGSINSEKTYNNEIDSPDSINSEVLNLEFNTNNDKSNIMIDLSMEGN
jgi:kinesin family protein 4/21/27